MIISHWLFADQINNIAAHFVVLPISLSILATV